MQHFFHTEIKEKKDLNTSNADAFKELYQQAIDEIFRRIPIFEEINQKKLNESLFNREGVIDLYRANIELRNVMAYEALNGLDQIAGKISHYFIEDIIKMVNWINDRLFEIPEVETEMIVSKYELEKTFNIEINALIQHLARPLVDLLLLYPRSMNIRNTLLQEYQQEVRILKNFVRDSKSLLNNVENRFEEFLNSTLENNASSIKKESEGVEEDNLNFSEDSESYQKLIDELKEDTEKFIEFLKNSVFYGSGILKLYNHKREKYRRKFLDHKIKSRTWEYHVRTQFNLFLFLC